LGFNQRGDALEIFFFGLIGVVFIIAFLPLMNDLVGTSITNANAATNLTYMSFATVILSMFGFIMVILFVRAWWRTSGMAQR
jgi:hypothetical protein